MATTTQPNSTSTHLSANNKATLTWIIYDFKSKTSSSSSPIFYFPQNNNIQFKLFQSPRHQMPFRSVEYLTVALFLSDSDQPEISVRYQISIVNANEEKCNAQDFQFKMAKEPYERRVTGCYTFDRESLLDPANKFLVNGKLTIYCEVELSELSNIVDYELCFKKASCDYELLLDNSKFADVTLLVCGKELKAHKIILTARSPVFSAMFEYDCKEKHESKVEINDIPLDVFEQLLRYIYATKIPDLEQFAPDLLIAADKYQIDCLKTLCAQYLASNLSVDSVVETLLLADLHQVTKLKINCIDFITERVTKVMATNGWKLLMDSKRVDLVAEVLKNLGIKTGR